MTKNAQIERLKKIEAALSKSVEDLIEEIAGLESGEQAETHGAQSNQGEGPGNPPPNPPSSGNG